VEEGDCVRAEEDRVDGSIGTERPPRRKQKLGLNHVSTLDTFNIMVSLYLEQGMLVGAEEMFQDALNGYEKILEPDYTLIIVVMMKRIVIS